MASSQVATHPDMDAARALLGVVTSSDEESETHSEFDSCAPNGGRPRSGSVGLDALAQIATAMDGPMSQRKTHASSDDDSEAMPPPPPRPRSVSNPEGMEKWDSYLVTRKHFVLPPRILEEKLAEACAAAAAHPGKKKKKNMSSVLASSPNSVASPMKARVDAEEEDDDDDDDDEASLEPKELLRRARARLFEDLSEGNLSGEKGLVVLPHKLPKYDEIYNKNGRIGIYTQLERAAIIARFLDKRTRRVWNKKIRYNCRKSLADRRMRVKGRFVKRATEARARASACSPPSSGSASPVHPTIEEDKEMVLELPDVNDPEAGFCPTDDQPFRRARRHTIT